MIQKEVSFRKASIPGILGYLEDVVAEQTKDEALNFIVIMQDWSTNQSSYCVTYKGSNVTVGVVLQEAVRQAGLSVAFIAEATFVGTHQTVRRIHNIPGLPTPASRLLAERLDQRLEYWEACQANIYDVAAFLTKVTGTPIDLTEAGGSELLFERRFTIRNMKVSNFLWWMSVHSGDTITFVNDTVKFTLEKPNK